MLFCKAAEAVLKLQVALLDRGLSFVSKKCQSVGSRACKGLTICSVRGLSFGGLWLERKAFQGCLWDILHVPLMSLSCDQDRSYEY